MSGDKSVADLVTDCLLRGQGCFLTGPGGTGKTYNTRIILEKLDGILNVVRTATTGVASLNLQNGTTLHSAFALPVGKVPNVPEWIRDTMRLKNINDSYVRSVLETIRTADVILIDEISMCSAWLLEMLDIRLRVIRECPEKPFGGIVPFLVGDFLQLAPVYNPRQKPPPHPRSKMYAFESPVWYAANIKTFTLTKVFRQSDSNFVDICNTLRRGEKLEKSVIRSLIGRNSSDIPKDAVRVMVKRDDVFKANNESMDMLKSELISIKFPSFYNETNPKMGKALLSDVKQGLYIPYETNVQTFKVGCRVMLVINYKYEDTDGNKIQYVNGDRGTVVGFRMMSNYTSTLEEDDGIGLLESSLGAIPVVRFDRTETLLKVNIHLFERSVKQRKPNGEHVLKDYAGVGAIPLCLAFAATVHKCQGATISGNVHIDCKLMDFIPASMYVALSRATDLGNVTFTGFKREGKCYHLALEFYDGKYTCPASDILEKIIKAVKKTREERQTELDNEWSDIMQSHLNRSRNKNDFINDVQQWIDNKRVKK